MTNAALSVASSTLNPWIVAARAAAIDVIDQALSLSSRVIEDAAVPTNTMGALIPIVSEMAPVQIGLFSDEAGCQSMARALLYCGPTDPLTRAEMIDAMSELVNMLAGSVKARVARYASHAALGLPTFVHGPVEASSSTVVETVPLQVGDAVALVVIARTVDG